MERGVMGKDRTQDVTVDFLNYGNMNTHTQSIVWDHSHGWLFRLFLTITAFPFTVQRSWPSAQMLNDIV